MHLRAHDAKPSATALIAAVSPMFARTSVRTRKGGFALDINGAGGRCRAVGRGFRDTPIVDVALWYTAICFVTFTVHVRANETTLPATALITAVGPL